MTIGQSAKKEESSLNSNVQSEVIEQLNKNGVYYPADALFNCVCIYFIYIKIEN